MGDGAAIGTMLRRYRWVLAAIALVLAVATVATANSNAWTVDHAGVSEASSADAKELLDELGIVPIPTIGSGDDDWQLGDAESEIPGSYERDVNPAVLECAGGLQRLPGRLDFTEDHAGAWVQVRDMRTAPTMVDFLDGEFEAGAGVAFVEVAVEVHNGGGETMYPDSEVRLVTGDAKSRLPVLRSPADWLLDVDSGETRAGVLVFAVPAVQATVPATLVVGGGMFIAGDAERFASRGACARSLPTAVDRVGDHPDIVRETY